MIMIIRLSLWEN